MTRAAALPADLPWFTAPAKLNLFLHITGRRADGYHELQTLFQLLDRGDRLAFEGNDSGRIRRRGEVPGVAPEDDLTVRAARALQARCGTRQGADIYLDKRLPLGGGLGGGSSDAATVLRVLDRLWGCHLPEAELLALARGLGADVPVFVAGHSAWAEGIGERLTPVSLPPAWYLVVRPPVAVATAELFAAPELTRDCRPIKIRDFLAAGGENVFEPLVRRRYPAVREALDWLARHAPARLTGTGSCLFAAFATQQAAEAVRRRLPVRWSAFVAAGVDRSPLLRELEAAPAHTVSWAVAKR